MKKYIEREQLELFPFSTFVVRVVFSCKEQPYRAVLSLFLDSARTNRLEDAHTTFYRKRRIFLRSMQEPAAEFKEHARTRSRI